MARSMKTSMKKSKLSFETMDSTICLIEENGKETTLSKRCADANNQMASEMGVSKAILNNVIFCHQEDSSWPLDEQKKLKEKFDAIFGTTEYNKAIDKVMAMKKAYTEKRTLKERDLKEFLLNKGDCDRKQLELKDATAKLDQLNGLQSKVDDEMRPIREQLDEIRKIELGVSKWVAERTAIQTKLDNCKETQSKLRSKIKVVQEEKSIDDLESELHAFKLSVIEKRNDLQEKERLLSKGTLEEKALQRVVNDLMSKSGTLQYKRKTEQELTANRTKKLQKLCLELSITFEGGIEDSQIDLGSILIEIETAFEREEAHIKDLSAKHDKMDEEFQSQINSYREKVCSIEAEIASKREQITRLKRDERKLETQINEIESSAEVLKKLDRELKQVDREYDAFQSSTDLEQLQRNLDKMKAAKSGLESEMERLDEEIHFLTSIASLTNNIDLKTGQLEEKQSEMDRLKNKHQSNLKLLLHKTIDRDYRRTVLAAQQQLKSDKKEAADELKSRQMRFAASQSNRKSQSEHLKKIKAELGELEEKVYEVCGGRDYEDMVLKKKDSLAKIQLEFGAVKSSEALYKKYIDDLKGQAGCPLCHTKMTEREQRSLSDELLEEISSLPNKIREMGLTLNREQKAFDDLLSLRPSVQSLERLRVEIPDVEGKVRACDSALKDDQMAIEKLEAKCNGPDQKLEIISSIIGDMQSLDEGNVLIEKLGREIDSLKARIPKRESSTNLDDAQLQKSTLLSEIKSVRLQIDRAEQELSKARKHYNDLCEKRNSIKRQQLNLQEGIQALTQLKERFEEISSQIVCLCEEISANEESLKPIKSRLLEVTREKQSTKNKNRQTLDTVRQKVSRLRDQNKDIEGDTQQLEQLAAENLASCIEKLERQLKETKQEMKLKQDRIKEVEGVIDTLRVEITNQATLERDLQDNLELKEKQEQERELMAKYLKLKKTIDDADYERVDKTKRGLLKQQEGLTAHRGEIIGQQYELKAQAKRMQEELNGPRYRDAAKNYRSAFYATEVLKQTIADLNQYKVALEWALLKYHAEHMERINELIREFWRDIYRGNDIDYVQIRTDEQATGGDKRRSYNYRVVQCKNGTEIDMRGRCSAGQRVLASLIIRMALAETFSSNCGVLALDEPTTNLDKENIESLCMSLRKIIEARKTQVNFMLLVITHDEDFVQSLGNIDV